MRTNSIPNMSIVSLDQRRVRMSRSRYSPENFTRSAASNDSVTGRSIGTGFAGFDAFGRDSAGRSSSRAPQRSPSHWIAAGTLMPWKRTSTSIGPEPSTPHPKHFHFAESERFDTQNDGVRSSCVGDKHRNTNQDALGLPSPSDSSLTSSARSVRATTSSRSKRCLPDASRPVGLRLPRPTLRVE